MGPLTNVDRAAVHETGTCSPSEKSATPRSGPTSDTKLLHSMTINTSHAAKLKTLLEDCPREIYDMIQDLTLTTCSVPIHCDLGDSKTQALHIAHLKLLQIDSASRQRNASLYYCPRTFLLDKHIRGSLWLQSVPAEHRAMMGKILCDIPVDVTMKNPLRFRRLDLTRNRTNLRHRSP